MQFCRESHLFIGIAVGKQVSARLQHLTDGQRECLRRVLTRKSSKEIALELGISPHTVDQRLRGAIQALGVANRFEAARIFAEHEPIAPYQPPLYQPSDIATEGSSDDFLARTAAMDGAAGGAQGDGSANGQTAYSISGPRRPTGLPFPQARGGRNELSIAVRLGWILAIAMGSVIAFGTFLTGIQALTILVTGRG